MGSIISCAKKNIKIILRKAYPFKCEIKKTKKWYGNEYGGFFVAPDCLNKDSIVYSFGIGEDISFDTEIINQIKCSVHGFDPTPKSINWVKNNTQIPSGFFFHEYGIDKKDGVATFYLPKNTNYVSGSIVKGSERTSEGIEVQMKSLKTICQELGHDCIDILKMDIEGAEYSVIPEILSSCIKIKQILIEFHYRFFEDGFNKNKEIIALLKKNGFKIFAVSDSLEEVSFINENL
ncbi:MAG: hypothetical protein A2275_18000 [Bacteroidetes bacterium RIFOXYA12_FULL_35_11]|nr:MAG: hypothetical protein A2X01_04725 [Bacteroidetes bacterium GWF2_35_48]OFY72487.1 MAG: hypothetical protein A2275_18000 [Bacteroidetes bacterium RIFOXYA12_FULL_35_11]OFY92283.1 MAG: hypothetical protein A2309_06515 [Bacteroidetes bacterium RIFOXYB2_FULL_35_7]OFZ00928.1 MAG: hypothetical protein A2491_04085 [Bacteroidetes bacterium RIFOXYC12_FULL_35_7]HBX51988.1 hypothetical protein [Bacteroidales bacterium]